MNFLEAKNIYKNYSHHRALDNVSINVKQGRVFGLLGPNGAGKTTLIRIINRITAPDRGEVFFDGHHFTEKDIARIGYLPEERGLYRKMKVGEQALYLAGLKGMHKQEAARRLREWFEKFEIMSWWNRKVEELSKGMQQKVQFICTVIHNPDLFIFDEPFSGFDPVNADLLKQSILELKAEGKTIIFSTHNMQSVEEICNDIALINKSRVVLSGEVTEVRERFDNNIVRVALACETPILPAQLSQFNVIESEHTGRQQIIRISIKKEENVRDVVAQLPSELQIISVERELPSMHDIFVQTVKDCETSASDSE